MPLQPVLQKERVLLQPLTNQDFDALYAVAADPAIWAQHPSNDRWQEDVFRSFFAVALESKGAFLIFDKASGEVAGSTRYYDYNEQESSVAIGYTFYATRYWGTGFNPAVKRLMLDHAFQYVNTVFFHVGATNVRSQIAMGRVGALKVGEMDFAPVGSVPKPYFLYAIQRADYEEQRKDAGLPARQDHQQP
ncbi:GNAT family N-acetyltransferase [Paraflavitalea pollutisoli]|uniref:GNAT family N-acetyltransferase n=1 Tax=Paraflavitalea pollutisoli TaxID=3034143 RepID=UPI0023EC265D|nr:GNAT family N-acetyltransferase [Paraflavitalea sp. H1-2-19X]